MPRKPGRKCVLTVLASLALGTALPAAAGPLGRDHEPVVLTGADLPGLAGADPAAIVAFRYAGGWQQVPVQVDERAVVDFGQVYNDAPQGTTFLAYTDPGTFTGADPDPGLDADDEVVLRAADAGDRWPGGDLPAGVIPGTMQELGISNLLDGLDAWAYLFETDGSLDPAAGVAPIDYAFVLLSGDYKSTYRLRNGPNPEDSRVTTGAYSVHFADRWIRDETSVSAGAATGVDVLDRHKNLFGPGNCSRTENTFSGGEGAFVVNRSGPVRALRGYLGANSGPTTHRLHKFYEELEQVVTTLRVHPIPGVMDYFDYEPAATGMRYHNDANPAGVVIDGVPDAVVPAELSWEMVTGSQGTLAHAHAFDTDIPGFDTTSYYSDDVSPSTTQCTGDAFEYGASGIHEDDPIPNTDPNSPDDLFRLEAVRTIRYGAPDQGAAFARRHFDETRSPFAVTVNPDQNCPDADADGFAVCAGGCDPAPGDLCGDCDDLRGNVNPAAAETCDGLDNDCDGTSADGADEPWLGAACDGADADLCEEGVLSCSGAAQTCDDATGDTPEVCDNLLDDDCDGFTDQDDADCGAADPAALDSLSTEGHVGTGENVLIGGFIVSGAGPKTVLVRVLGPSRAAAVASPLADPALELYDETRRRTMQNDDWRDGGQAAEISASGLAPPDDAEPALIATVTAGEYTAVARGAGGTTGQAWIEVHELDPAETPRLVNVSTRGRVRGNQELLVGKLIVRGSSQKRVILRALGPTLGSFAVGAPVADPALELRQGAAVIASNADWSTSADAAAIDDTGFAPPDAVEAAILRDLAPGEYDVVASGQDGAAGVALLEVYDLDDNQVSPLELRRVPRRRPAPPPDGPEARDLRGDGEERPGAGRAGERRYRRR